MMKVALVVLLNAIYLAQAYPDHASCQLKWDFQSMPCDQVMDKIVKQIDAWSGEELCNTGTDQVNEKCLYTLTYREEAYLEAIHETPEKHYVDDLFMTFTSQNNGSGCDVDGFSTSEIWYAVLDSATNYCNLHNLVDGAGLTQMNDFLETTSDDICTQYSTANCDRY